MAKSLYPNLELIKAKQYILFDGDCGFCNKTILYVAKKDSRNKFIFVSNKSDFGKRLLLIYKVQDLANDTIILIQNNNWFVKSEALKRISSQIPDFKYFTSFLRIVPEDVLNRVYLWVSRIRKELVSQKTCQIPDSSLRKKIII